MTRITSFCVLCLLAGVALAHAATSDVADAAMQGNREAVRAAIARKADVNVPQIDGTTALHWAAERDDLDMADLLIRAGARLTVKTR
ncbi:MAG TPA: ankyrin repeat domain-containing protein, partial [Vicinamibacterales bacterium]|nr:ankyrin repeat domain-containing protein [Vicinamibacterales bacterium]